MSKNNTSKITIGLPVYNGEKWVARAINSVLKQTYKDFILVISDNASLDKTGEICNEASRFDQRVRYIRQEKNIGATDNFKFLIEKAKTEFFVFLAHDDYWDERFLESNLGFLEKNPSFISSISKVSFEKEGIFDRESRGVSSITGDIIQRLKTYLIHPQDNSRFYSLFRTPALRSGFDSDLLFHASDWYVMAKTLILGQQNCLDVTAMHREVADQNRYNLQASKDNRGLSEYLNLPVLPMSFCLIKHIPLYLLPEVLPALIKLNISKHLEYIRYKKPASFYTRLIGRLISN